MIRAFIVLLVAAFICSLSPSYSVEVIDGVPPKTFTLQLPDGVEKNWKEISRYVNKNQGLVEKIPVGQTVKNWTDLIIIRYISNSQYEDKTVIESVENLIQRLNLIADLSYPRDITSWNLIETNENEFIYESILHVPYNQTPIQHDISRVILTKDGMHQIGFTKKNSVMGSEEKNKWIKVIKESTRLVKFQDSLKSEELSMVDPVKASIDLTDNFEDWFIAQELKFVNGHVLSSYVPTRLRGSNYITETLEVLSTPTFQETNINEFFAFQKNQIFKKGKGTTKFKVLEKSKQEIVYYYSQPHDHLRVNTVVRDILTDYGYYSINYKIGLQGYISTEDIMKWKTKLKSIKVK